MFCLKNLLNKDASRALHEFARSCVSEEDLITRIKEEPSWVISIFENMNLEKEGSASLAAKILYHISLDDIKSPVVKNVEAVLRNKGLLNRDTGTDFSLNIGDKFSLLAHSSILALESPYFKGMKGFEEFQTGTLAVEEAFAPEVLKHVVDYLYLSDEKREEFITTVDKALLPSIAALADLWEVEELRAACDEELYNSLAEIRLEKSDIDEWLRGSEKISKDNDRSESLSDSSIKEEPQPIIAAYLPKFAMLLQFIKRIAGKGNIESVIAKTLTWEGATQLAARCTPEEIKAFSTLKTEFGKVCRIPEGAFGPAEWEKNFPVTIKPEWVPQLPKNIHAILEQDDPTEPGKKLKETCTLFLRPKKVILHEEDGSEKELYLTFDGVEELAKKATNPNRRTKYCTFDKLRNQLNQIQAAEAGWVLMRKELIPNSRNKDFRNQKQLLKGSFEVPKIMDAILLNVITYAGEEKYLYGRDPWTFTRCQEKYKKKYKSFHTVVGGFAFSGLTVSHDFDCGNRGLSGAWKF
ncbi:MAG: BTB/POZ domain-containing protein [Chlamydiales bacterium]|nr:BTB/POZ domain-containing protein [Chlamydiales bacterium]